MQDPEEPRPPGVDDDNNDNNNNNNPYSLKAVNTIIKRISGGAAALEINQQNYCHYLSSQAHNHSRSDVYHSSVVVLQKSRIMRENDAHESKFAQASPPSSSPSATSASSKWKASIKGVYQGLQLRQMGNRRR